MDPRIVFVGREASSLTDDDSALRKLNLFLKSQPEGAVLQVEVFPNFDATSDESMPSGMNVILSPSAKVDPSLLSENMFQTLAVSKIVPVEGQLLTDATFSSLGEEVNDAVRQFPEQPISGKVHNRHTNEEIAAWAPELGGVGSFVGVYSQMRDDHRTKDYFVAARGTAPLYIQDMKKKIEAEAPTYGDLLNDTEWRRFMGAAENAARRNVFRSMANVAEACGVQIVRADDVLNGAPHQDLNLAYPELAVPEWEEPTHAIRATTFERKPAVAISYGVVPVENCFTLEDQKFFVVANPYDGIASFTLSNRHDMARHSGLPADTGRAIPVEKLSSSSSMDYAHRIQGMVWEQSRDGKLVSASHHVDLHPDAFRKVDKSFKKAMRSMGWNPDEDHQMERMVCVLAKIYNPEIRRN